MILKKSDITINLSYYCGYDLYNEGDEVEEIILRDREIWQ